MGISLTMLWSSLDMNSVYTLQLIREWVLIHFILRLQLLEVLESNTCLRYDAANCHGVLHITV